MAEKQPTRCNLKPIDAPHMEGSTQPYEPGKKQKGGWVERKLRCEGGCPFGTEGRRIQARASVGPKALEELNDILEFNQGGCDGQRRYEDYLRSHPS